MGYDTMEKNATRCGNGGAMAGLRGHNGHFSGQVLSPDDACKHFGIDGTRHVSRLTQQGEAEEVLREKASMAQNHAFRTRGSSLQSPLAVSGSCISMVWLP